MIDNVDFVDFNETAQFALKLSLQQVTQFSNYIKHSKMKTTQIIIKYINRNTDCGSVVHVFDELPKTK